MNHIDLIEKNESLQIKALQEFASIKSVTSNPVSTKEGEFYPFGKDVQDAFAWILKHGEELGFETKNVDNYGGHIDFGYGNEILGIIGHVDVVPEGDDWDFDPYSGTISDGYIYGRGTTDDKGPVIAALYAMKALKDSGYEPAKKVRLILGLDEETEWKGMYYYLEREKAPDFGFTPDAEFPALNGEKGIVSFDIAKKLDKSQGKGLSLSKLSGGDAVNMVPEKARAVVKADDPKQYEVIRSQVETYRQNKGYKIYAKGVGKSLEIAVNGKSAHGSTPEQGINAISVLMDFLQNLNFVNDDINTFIDFYNKYFGFDVNGDALGIGFSDEPSGKLTLNTGVISYNKESITLSINVRYPVTFDVEQVYEPVLQVVEKYNMGVIKGKHRAPIYMEKDAPMIKTLMESYVKFTGDEESEPVVIGGGTYARCAKNIIAFGPMFPGEEELAHQRNERLSLEKFILMTKIYADAIYNLTQGDFVVPK